MGKRAAWPSVSYTGMWYHTLVKRVVVTGIGSVGPSGNSFDRSWRTLKAGFSGIGPITKFDVSGLPWKVAGEVKDFEGTAYLSIKEIARLDPFVHYAVAASVMAVQDAGLTPSDFSCPTYYQARDSAGVIVGSSRGGIGTIEKALVGNQTQKVKLGRRNLRLSPYLMPSTTIGMAASYVAQKLGIRGHCLGISNACASGTNAVGEAFRQIKSGYSRLIIAGGSEAPLCRLCVEGYGKVNALSKKLAATPKPFGRDRDGFVLSEGSCLLVVEEYEQALQRGAVIYGEIVGYGNTSDSFHMTKPDPEGEARAMALAISEGGLRSDEVDYINTHGTGTQIGDGSESQAIEMVFGKRASKIHATAIKSMTGHLLAASGAFEIASTLMTMREGIIPPTINLDDKDPACGINIVTEKKKADIGIAISNSFGFGGVNAVIALKKV